MILPSRELMPVIRAALERGQGVRMTVNGSSMTPFIHDGDVVELKSVCCLPAVGDIVLAQSPGPDGRYRVHRVVRLEGDRFFLCGDAQKQWEGPFTRRDVLGKAVVSYRHGRRRVMDCGPWRFAGLMWARYGPLGRWLLGWAVRVRAKGRGMLRRLQHASIFRA